MFRPIVFALSLVVLAAASGPRDVRIHTVARARTSTDASPEAVMPRLIGLSGYIDAAAAMETIGCSLPTARLHAATARQDRTVWDQHPRPGSLLTISNGMCLAADGRPVAVSLIPEEHD